MSNYTHVTIEKHIHSPSYSLKPPERLTEWAPCKSCINSSPAPGLRPLLSTSCEIISVGFASIVTTAYTLHHRKRIESLETGHVDTESRILAFEPGFFSVVLDPSPALMLSSCLVLGCAISSFAYRRQSLDRYQTFIFVIAITSASVAGLATQVDINLIMLGLVPWTMWFTMLFSSSLHWLVRRYNSHQNYSDSKGENKETLLPHRIDFIGA